MLSWGPHPVPNFQFNLQQGGTPPTYLNQIRQVQNSNLVESVCCSTFLSQLDPLEITSRCSEFLSTGARQDVLRRLRQELTAFKGPDSQRHGGNCTGRIQ